MRATGRTNENVRKTGVRPRFSIGEPLSTLQDNRLVAVPAAVAALQVLPYVGEAVAGTVIGQEAMGHRVLQGCSVLSCELVSHRVMRV